MRKMQMNRTGACVGLLALAGAFGAFLAGCAYTFTAFHFGHARGHLHIQAMQWVRMGLPFQARRAFRLAAALGWAFLALQIPGLVALSGRYRPEGGERSVVYFLVLFLVGLHLLHAFGGLFPMTSLARRASFQRDDGPGMERLSNVGLYWHFLAGIWLAMFATFSLVR